MPTQENLVFLRAAVESGALDSRQANEVLGALERVEELGASASAREIAASRGFQSPARAAVAVQAPPPKRREAVRDGERASNPPPIPPPMGAGREPPPPAPARGPRTIGNYQLIEKLGVGGMGIVYKAQQLSMDRPVALKILPPSCARDRVFVERFLREARSAARLNHPNIVQAYDVGEADGLYYFAMELVDGESLRTRIARDGRVPEAELLEIARQTALALEHAHAHELVHRDIKPDNILLSRSGGAAKLADLGLAKHATDVSLTQHAVPMGTPLYMSPEQARGDAELDGRTDIYSLGVTLYFAAVGAPPFTGPTSAAVITKHLFERPPPPRAAAPELSEGFNALLLKMLAKKPQARHQTATELLRDIARVARGGAPATAERVRRPAPQAAPIEGGPATAPPESDTSATPLVSPILLRRPRRRRRRSRLLPLVSIGAVLAALLGIGLLVAGRGQATEQAASLRPSLPAASSVPAPAAPRDEGLAELERVHKWAKGGGDAKAVVKRLKSLVGRYPISRAVEPARAEIASLEQKLQAEARQALDAALAEAKRLAGEDHFDQAAALLDRFGEEHCELAAATTEARGALISDAAVLDRELREAARERADKGDLDGAAAIHRRIVAFGIPQFSGRARRSLAQLEEKIAAARLAAREKAQSAYLLLRVQWMALRMERQYEAVRRGLEGALGDPALAPVRAELEADLRDLDTLAELWALAERGAKELEPGTPFSVGGIRGTFERFAKGTLYVRASGVLCRKTPFELLAPEVLALADLAEPKPDARALAARGLFLVGEGKTDEAEAALREARKQGADVARGLALLNRQRTDRAEAEAESLLERAETLAGQDDWAAAADTLQALRDRLSSTQSFARHKARIGELAAQARRATLDVTSLFHGQARVVGSGRRVEVTYDFSDPAQLADWDLRGGQFDLKGSQLVLRGAQAVLRAPLEAEFQALIELADLTGPPGEWSVGMAEASAVPPAYAIVLPERAGLPLVLRAGTRDVARGAAPFRVTEPRKLAFALRPRGFAVAVDGKEVLGCRAANGRVPDGLRLSVACAGERAVGVSGVRVVGTVLDAWAKAELDELRSRLGRQTALARKPWSLLFNSVTLDPWAAESGKWEVIDDAATIASVGRLALRDHNHDDLELRLKIAPLKPTSALRVGFRVARTGEHYAVTLSSEASERCLALAGQGRPGTDEVLARFAESVDWRADRWYHLRIVAVGSEIRVELNGALLCLVRDDRRHGGGFLLDVLRDGAAIGDVSLRSLD